MPIKAKAGPLDRLFIWSAKMKTPGFSPDQMLAVLAVCLLIAGLAVWRYFTMF